MDTPKINASGEMHVIENGGITQYNILTHAGFYRGGKIYDAEKSCLILSGEAELTTFEDGEDRKRSVTAKDGEITVRGGIPNLFYFPVQTLMIEWFESGIKIEDYERYKTIK